MDEKRDADEVKEKLEKDGVKLPADIKITVQEDAKIVLSSPFKVPDTVFLLFKTIITLSMLDVQSKEKMVMPFRGMIPPFNRGRG